MKTSELIGPALDWAVAKCEGASEHLLMVEYAELYRRGELNKFSSNWAQGGPIIEREGINLIHTEGYPWRATSYKGGQVWVDSDGPTPLIAAMRCLVASRLGDEVEIPEELRWTTP